MNSHLTYRHSVGLLCCLLAAITFSGCLTRKNALPSGKTVTHTPRKHASKGSILTDASSAPKNVRTGKQLLESYASVLGVPTGELQRPELYRFIDDWMGVPHRTGGTNHRGLDCSAFVGLVMQEVYNMEVPRTSKDMAEHIKRKYERQLREGDLVFFSFGRRNIDHVGIYLHNHKFVHVSTSKGVIISDLRDPWYYPYFTRGGTAR
ncbi:C40 family peptidase [Parapedobacter sp. 10938]|uniref:C40 family peptidase n=1 Tax=Parapedobacter flavus TaxID=3110225 RepID=UPI002DB64166|nr:NlpC/P60 family protein [Parapedobacter sp. 10938]MEC3879869.1 NlpC/P60 family protein [Parapedobacter sp. 10938]